MEIGGLVEERLERFRKKLLDTSRRNRLVNFRTHTASNNSPLEKVVVVDGEIPAKVLAMLVTESRSMSFLGVPDRSHDQDVLVLESDPLDDELDRVDQDDDKLSTRLTKTRLERHLTKIHRDQIEMIEEQGINALFLSLGVLKWYEADHSKELRIAPLALIPVLLNKTERGTFKINWDGTEVGSNLSLGALLKDEFDIELPTIESDELDVEGYFQRVQDAIENQPKWNIDRGAISLAFFSFAKYLIYKDLSPDFWPDRKILSHSVLEALLSSGFDEPANSLPEDTFLDEHRPVGETNEVFDADGSQTLAILQALQGHSMVIEGPPGTGKSQTIANLIAEFLGQGKKILFVSEKSAALNVVFDRLKNANLGGACLELHGTKANKRSFYQRLREMMEEAEPRLFDAEAMLRKLQTQRNNLNGYVHDLHCDLGTRLISPREAIGRLVSLGPEPDTEGRLPAELAANWNKTLFQEARDAVSALEQQIKKTGLPVDHPFFGSQKGYISPDDKADLSRSIGIALKSFRAFEQATERITERLNLEFPNWMKEVETLEATIDFVIRAPDCSGVDFSQSHWSNGVSLLHEAVARAKSADELLGRNQEFIGTDVWTAPIKQILSLLHPPGGFPIPQDSGETWKALDDAERSVNEVIRIGSHLSSLLFANLPPSLWAMAPLAELGMQIGKAPDCRGIQVDSLKWHSESQTIRESLFWARKGAELQLVHGGKIKPEAWSAPVSHLIEVLERDGHSLLRRTFGANFKSSRKSAISLLTGEPDNLEDLKASLLAIQEVQNALCKLEAGKILLQELFNDRWKGTDSAFDQLEDCATFLARLHSDIRRGKIAVQVLQKLYEPSTLQIIADQSELLRAASSTSVFALNQLQACLDRVKPDHRDSLTGDPLERLYRLVVEKVRTARLSSDELFTPAGRGLPWQTVAVRLTECLEIHDAKARVAELNPLMQLCLGQHWTARSCTWDQLAELITWVVELVGEVEAGKLPEGLITFFKDKSSKEGLTENLANLRLVRSEYSASMETVCSKALLSGGPEAFFTDRLSVQLHRIEEWASHVDDLEAYFRYNSLAEVCRNLGLLKVVELAQSWPQAADRLVRELDRAWCNSVIEEAMNERPRLRDFERQSHEEVIESFRRLDRTLIELNRARVAATHWRSVPRSSAVGEIGFIRMQMNRQRGHRPIRTAMREAASAIQEIKPVFLMSPMSVAMYLPQEGPLFDVVLFDEASQIKPEDALGSVVRAKQIIVVGDTKQMPPTSFFERLTSADDAEEEDFEDIETKDIADQESILAFASFRIAEGSPCRRDLRWHYRSRHEDLIKTSNRLFYRDRLVIFPQPRRSDTGMGLLLRHLPETVYGRGNTRKNELEAREVALAALEHCRLHPALSLGIAAFSKAQQECIEDQLDLLRKQDPALREFDDRHTLDRLFVKNLESIQGDERDVIFISIGYGRDENGFLAMNFGPVSREGGERRLNVLITRARVRTVVFSNFTASQMRMAESRSEGVKALHTFLLFAESGHLDVMPSTLKLEPSYFEECVYERLRNRGYEIDKQVGSEGFYIDMAVRHPEEPGRFVLGIECDGAMYHSAKSARDRDRLRQQVLEDRGWQIHRIWSTDWWRHPERELDRCCAAIQIAISSPANAENAMREIDELPPDSFGEIEEEGSFQLSLDADDIPPFTTAQELVRANVCEQEPRAVLNNRNTPQYIFASLNWPLGDEILELPIWKLASLIREVVKIEAPVHVDLITARIRDAAGKGRAGRLIREHIHDSIGVAKRQGILELRGRFAYTPAQSEFVVRNRGNLPSQDKKIEYVSPEEILEAAVLVLREAIAVETTEISRPIGNLLGFDRVTRETEAHIQLVIAEYAKIGRLSLTLGKLRLPGK